MKSARSARALHLEIFVFHFYLINKLYFSRPSSISQPIIHSLYEEMFSQARLEKDFNLSDSSTDMSESVISKEDQQIKFHKNFTLPLFRLLASAYPVTKKPYLSILEEVAEKEYGIELDNFYAGLD